MRERNSYSKIVQNVSAWTGLEKGKMIQLLHHCIEHKISTFENADFRAENYSGRKFGVALSESGLSRDQIQLVSKYNPEDQMNLSERVEQILLDLETDYLDLLLLNPSQKYQETHEAIAQLFSQGKILELGALNLSNNEMEETDVIFHAKQIKFEVSSFSDLNKLKPEIHPSEEIVNLVSCDFSQDYSEKAAFEEISSKYDMKERELLLAWILKHPAQLHPVINFTEQDDITRAASIKEKFLAPIDWQKINLLFS